MKRRLCLGLLILLIATALISCNAAGNMNENVPEDDTQAINEVVPTEKGNQYKINAELNAQEKTLTSKQSIYYVNTENVELKELYFHVYTNAFSSKETAPFLFDDFDRAYSRGFEPGNTQISTVKTKSGQVLKYSFQGEGNTILKVELAEGLKPGNAVELEMDYKVAIPPANERFGYGEDHFNLGNWYPVAAVYDKSGWNLDKYYPIGDPFYSDSSSYEVTIKAPKEYIIAASGNCLNDKEEGDNRIWEFQGNNMRDFAFVANKEFKVAEQKVDGTIVKSYYYKDDEKRGREALEIGVNSIKIFNEKFGKYPYPTYSVVETVFPSGMEYPGLVYISDNYYKSFANRDLLTIVIVHETGHQWFYSLVGNDQIDEAWLDEGFATYSESIYIENALSTERGKNYFNNSVEERHNEVIADKLIDGVVVRGLDDFKNWDDYGPTVYTRGAVVLNELRNKLGDEKFFQVIQQYFKEFEFKIATTEDFIRVSEEVSGQQLDDFYNNWLYAK
ncbi:MAG: family metallopeptidase [Clostridia bacterium]|nr:family metallopeptidase [Clostridia bacterium]